MQTTTNIGLKTYEATDPTDWLGEFNYNMNKIDTAVGAQNDAIDVIEETANTASTTADSASTTAGNALITANSASTTATEALTTANSASTTATEALTTANSASTTAGNAVTTANSANTTAGEALSTANSASTTASNALTTANSKASINDTTASSSTTYSSTKINNLLSNKENKGWTRIVELSCINAERTYRNNLIYEADEVIFEAFYGNFVLGTFILPRHFYDYDEGRILNIPITYQNTTYIVTIGLFADGLISYSSGLVDTKIAIYTKN